MGADVETTAKPSNNHGASTRRRDASAVSALETCEVMPDLSNDDVRRQLVSRWRRAANAEPLLLKALAGNMTLFGYVSAVRYQKLALTTAIGEASLADAQLANEHEMRAAVINSIVAKNRSDALCLVVDALKVLIEAWIDRHLLVAYQQVIMDGAEGNTVVRFGRFDTYKYNRAAFIEPHELHHYDVGIVPASLTELASAQIVTSCFATQAPELELLCSDASQLVVDDTSWWRASDDDSKGVSAASSAPFHVRARLNAIESMRYYPSGDKSLLPHSAMRDNRHLEIKLHRVFYVVAHNCQ